MWLTPWIRFKIKIYGVDPKKIKVSSEYSIELTSEEPTNGFLVSKFEEESTRHKIGYTINEWKSLTYAERALEIAIKRIESKVEYAQFLKSMGKI